MNSNSSEALLRRLLAEIPSIEVRHAFELSALIQHRKEIVRVVVKSEELKFAESLLSKLGVYVKQCNRGLATERTTTLGDHWIIAVPLDDPRVEWQVLLASWDDSKVELGKRLEDEGDSRQLGLLYGYPNCCIEAYESIAKEIDWLDILLADLRQRSQSAAPHYAQNKIAYLFGGASLLPDYFPCSLRCQNAVQLAIDLRESAIACGLNDLVTDVERELQRPILIWRGLVVQIADGPRREDGAILFSGETSLRFDWRPHYRIAPSFLEGVGGVQDTSHGIVLLDRTGRIIPESADADGAFISFARA